MNNNDRNVDPQYLHSETETIGLSVDFDQPTIEQRAAAPYAAVEAAITMNGFEDQPSFVAYLIEG